jgi:predicted permease
VSIDAATRDLAGISAALLPVWPDFRDSTAKLTPYSLRELIVGTSARQVGLLAGGVGLVLLIVIVNVASLVLVRATAREPELVVRVMLGAGRRRIARLLVTENLLLTLLAGGAGILIAVVGLDAAVAQLPGLRRVQDATIDWRVVLVGLSAAVAAGLVVSLTTLWSLSGSGALARHASGRRSGPGLRAGRLRAAFVVAEFALAWPLLVLAGLLTASLTRLQQVDPGFDPANLESVAMTLPSARYPDPAAIQEFWRRAEQRVSSIPGVESVGLVTELPPDRSGSTDNFNLVSRPVPEGQAEPQVPWYYASEGYFDALGVRLLEGRHFLAGDTLADFPVVIVSRSWAQRFLGELPAVGQQLVQGGCYACPRTTVIGVVEDMRNLGPSMPSDAVYGPLTQAAPRSMYLVARVRGLGSATARQVSEAVRGLDPELPLTTASLASRLETSLADPRRWATALGIFSAVGLGLASIGIFGLMAYTVRQRRREIGVRLALGADPGGITRRMVVRGVTHAAAGSAAGIVLTLLVTDRSQGLLYGVGPRDVRTYVIVGAVLLASAALASWLPARRAARVRPLEAMAAE